MTRHRVILPHFPVPNSLPAPSVELDSETEHYLLRVLRLQLGDSVEVCNGDNLSWRAELVELETGAPGITWLEKLETRNASFPVVLAQGMPKSDKLENILQKSTELGVESLIPFFSKHCVVKPKPDKQKKRLDRWQKIVQEASRQCRRTDVPQVHTPVSLSELPDVLPPGYLRLVCWEGETSQSLRNWMIEHADIPGVVLAVGPEGGFSEEEITYLGEHGFASVGLGPLILRTETAGPAVLSVFQFVYGSFGDTVPKT
ncbi:MAG: 16S rRNA (uracil(1498)-N(3))-methyltransferase [Deltaproteobacteria bacterium]|nr:MAG: 16S rRNA (uracil(1498)-N(3))-methyltransferase [Deltaproteobacteria bacterium]